LHAIAREQLSSSPTCSVSQKFIFANSAASIRLGASISIERWQISSTGKSAGFFLLKHDQPECPLTVIGIDKTWTERNYDRCAAVFATGIQHKNSIP
jgi:hypothetical protein